MAHADLIPMIDIIFQLVVFFMVAGTLRQLPGIQIELPKSETSQAVHIENIVISINSENRFFYQDEPKSLNEIQQLLQAVPADRRSEQSVVVRGDTQTDLGAFVAVLDLLRKNGFENYSVPVTVTPSR